MRAKGAVQNGWLAEIIDHRLVRVTLAALIVISLLPFESLEHALRPVFLGVFGVEWTLRLTLFITRQKKLDRAEAAFFFFDFVALLSFLPLEGWLGARTEWLRAFRLVRLLALLRFTRALARDVYRVLTRREQLQQLGLVTVAVVSLSFIGAVILGQVGVAHDYDGEPGTNEDFWDQIWWSFRQVESPDNLVSTLSAHPLVLVISLVLTITGIFVFSYLIGVGANVVEQVIRAERRRPVDYQQHTLVVGPVHENESLVREFVRIYEKNRALRRIAPLEIWRWLVHRHPRPRRQALPRIALLSAPESPPSYLYAAKMRWVVYRQGEGAEPEALERVSVPSAKRVVLLAPRRTSNADALTIARLAAIRAQNHHAHIFVEVRDSRNASIVHAVGGGGTFALDSARFRGLFLCHHLIVPGIDRLLRELLSAAGSELYTHLFVEEWEHQQLEGKDIDFAALAHHALQRGVTLVGAFLGEPIEREHGLVPVDRVRPWVNPFLPDGGTESPIQGVFGIADTYLPLRQVVRDLQTGSVTPATVVEDPDVLRRVDLSRDPPPREILIVGFSSALPHLVAALARFVDDVCLRVVLDGSPEEAAQRCEALGVSLDAPERELDRGGRLIVFHRPDDLARSAASCQGERIDAAVFLADDNADDVDAATALRVLHFAGALSTQVRLCVEVAALHRGRQLEDQLARLGADHELVLVGTQQIHNYFMVHSAFVPGLTGIYENLLGARGREILRVPMTPGAPLRVEEAWTSFAARGCIPIAYETADKLLVNPPARRELTDLRAVYVIAEADDLADRLALGDEDTVE